jgi:hypothetical protein
MTAKINYKLTQGSTFREVLRWESNEVIYKPITAVTKSAPVSITSVGHGLVEGWRFRVTNCGGMREINSDQYHSASVVDVDTITINKINSLSYTTYTSGGVIEYNKPVDLTGMTARMQLRSNVASDVVINELTTENGGIVLDNALKQIRLNISATITTGFTFTTAVYGLELVSSGGIVTPLAAGNIQLTKEVTR